MAAEDKPNILAEILAGIEAGPETTAVIWRKMPEETLAAEAVRLQERFLDLAGRVLLLEQVRGER